jgi:hypothetical protein
VALRYGARTSPKEVPRSSPQTAALFPIPLPPRLQLSLDLSLLGQITPDQVPLIKKNHSEVRNDSKTIHTSAKVAKMIDEGLSPKNGMQPRSKALKKTGLGSIEKNNGSWRRMSRGSSSIFNRFIEVTYT